MADLAGALAKALGGASASLLRGRVVSIQTGTCTVALATQTVEKVAYEKDRPPAVNDEVVLASQQDFGLVVLMSLAPRPANPGLPAQTVSTVDPSTLANFTALAGTWNTAPAQLVQSQDFAVSGVWFYPVASLSGKDPDALSSLEIYLERTGGDYVALTLHSTLAPTGVFQPDDTQSRPLRLPLEGTWVQLPLGWARALIDGDARGITARSRTFDATLSTASGTLRFTTL